MKREILSDHVFYPKGFIVRRKQQVGGHLCPNNRIMSISDLCILEIWDKHTLKTPRCITKMVNHASFRSNQR